MVDGDRGRGPDGRGANRAAPLGTNGGGEEWTGLVLVSDPTHLLLHGSDGTMESLTLVAPSASSEAEDALMTIAQPAASLAMITAPGGAVKLQAAVRGHLLRRCLLDAAALDDALALPLAAMTGATRGELVLWPVIGDCSWV